MNENKNISFGCVIRNIRSGSGISQIDFAKKLGITRQKLSNLENEISTTGIRDACCFATILKHNPEFFVQLAIQDELIINKLNFKVRLE